MKETEEERNRRLTEMVAADFKHMPDPFADPEKPPKHDPVWAMLTRAWFRLTGSDGSGHTKH